MCLSVVISVYVVFDIHSVSVAVSIVKQFLCEHDFSCASFKIYCLEIYPQVFKWHENKWK